MSISQEEIYGRVIPALRSTGLLDRTRGLHLTLSQALAEMSRGTQISLTAGSAKYRAKRGMIPKAQWLAALESGTHAQTHGVLFDAEAAMEIGGEPVCRTCCIGVAPKLAHLPFFIENEQQIDLVTFGQFREVDTLDAASLIQGMTETDMNLAVHMNDKLRFSFAEIATVFRVLWDMPH